MSGHIGIVACSAEGAALCYRTICQEGARFLGEQMHPEVTMHTYPLGLYMKYIDTGDWGRVADMMLTSAEILARAGADFIICPDNTIHRAFDRVVSRSPLPWLHIGRVVALQAGNLGLRKLGVLGTRYLMEGPVYSDRLAKEGLEHRIPVSEDREEINRIIFQELVNGQMTDPSRRYFGGVIDRLKEAGCDGVVLGCTEIPLLVTQETSSLPILDSTRLLARAALERAVTKGSRESGDDELEGGAQAS